MRRAAWLAPVLGLGAACADISGLASGGGAPRDAGSDVAAFDAADGAGPCAAGKCAVELVAQADPSADSLVVDDAYATWVERNASGAVRRAPVTTLGAPTTLAASQPNPFAVTLFAGDVVWTASDNQSLNAWTQPGDGGTARIATLPGPTWLAASQGALYVASRSSPGSPSGEIASCQLTGCRAALYNFESSLVDQLRATPDGIAWVLGATHLRACATATCYSSVLTVLTEPDGIAAFAVDRDFYYVARRGGVGGVYAVSIAAGDAGTPVPLTSEQGISSVVVDGGSVFYASSITGVIARVPRAGGAPTVLAATAGQPKSLVVQGAYVYWIDAADGAIRRTAR